MEKFEVFGGQALRGKIKLSGAKNVAMKTIIGAILTDDQVIVRNVPLISSVTGTAEIVKPLNVEVKIKQNNTIAIDASKINNYAVPLDMGGLYRTATMVIGPLLHRFGKAIVPNPGGCRLGKRPIERHIEGLKMMGAKIYYKEGYFYANSPKLSGIRYKFAKNTHTGTETLLLAAVLADGETVLENAAFEPEVDDLIGFLNSMGAKIKRTAPRTIVIEGVTRLKGTEYTIMPDRNEAVTFAIAAYITQGDLLIEDIGVENIRIFLDKLTESNLKYEVSDQGIRFYTKTEPTAINIVTQAAPGFMTDWQAPWAVLATQSVGTSTIHETIFESRFSYVDELRKMGARIEFFTPKVTNPKQFYNFNWEDRNPEYKQAIRIYGPVKLHNAVVEVCDLRAGATLVLAALAARGKSTIYGIEHIDRGYERFDERLIKLGAKINRIKE